MSAPRPGDPDPGGPRPGDPGLGDPRPGDPAVQPPTEEELRAAYEAELDRIDAIDMIAQAAVSLLNIGARRLGPPPPPPGESPDPAAAASRDLEQAGDAIDAARALLAILERRIPEETKPLKDALSRLQMAYASEVGTAASGQAGAPGQAGASAQPSASAQPGAPGQSPAAGEPHAGEPPPAEASDPKKPGPAESSGRLWVPGS